MTADEAAQSWFIRGKEIIDSYRSRGPSSQSWTDSHTAQMGAQSLLQNRFNELSDSSVNGLYKMIAAMTEISDKSVGEAMGSPLGAAIDEFFEAIHEDIMRAKYVGKKAVDDTLDAGKWVIIAAVIIAVALAFRR